MFFTCVHMHLSEMHDDGVSPGGGGAICCAACCPKCLKVRPLLLALLEFARHDSGSLSLILNVDLCIFSTHFAAPFRSVLKHHFQMHDAGVDSHRHFQSESIV